ncbi:MAG: zinc-dependent alcohol dehydrogenase family protein [Gemmatimonadetes bacterium]|nr:zinc-dependent alcohol dehydrogenase family protein [Gemmatimonadota bacterium]
MKAALYDEFRGPLRIGEVDPPVPGPGEAIVKVEASGLCRSDWHGWMGHDPDIVTLPHVPGHELAGTIAARGESVTRFAIGDRVTVPFVSGCGACPECRNANHHICDNQYQPGFHGWGSFATHVRLRYADENLVRLPDAIDFVTAASLGCRFSTSFRAVVEQGRVARDQWVAVHGCGGVGLSAIMIAHALGARVVAVDIDDEVLALAESLGARATLNAARTNDVASAIHDIAKRGAHVSIDALGSEATCANSIACLRKRGRHVQVGLLAGDSRSPRVPMDLVIARELELVGSHGMQAARYDAMFGLIASGDLDPGRLVRRTIALEEVPDALPSMGSFGTTGITVIDRF